MATNDKNGSPLPSSSRTPPEKAVLNPLFGASCKTQSFAFLASNFELHQFHFQAYLSDTANKKWTVCRVTQTVDGKDARVSVQNFAQGVSFTDAIELLRELEKRHVQNKSDYKVLYPEAPYMGFDHYRAFAEREGYVYAANGRAYARPSPYALPSGPSFLPEDIAQSDRNLQRLADDFHDHGPASKIPNAVFIFEAFNSASPRRDFRNDIAEMRAIDLLLKFADQIETAHKKMTEYCHSYQTLGKGELILAAEKSLHLADISLRQLKVYGLETQSLESFTMQCLASCHVLHAQGLYDLMRKRLGDFDENEAAFKNAFTKATETYKRIDASAEGTALLQEMISQGKKPIVPPAIQQFLDNFRKHQNRFENIRNSMPHAPRTPKP